MQVKEFMLACLVRMKSACYKVIFRATVGKSGALWLKELELARTE